jgi:hypothetical protein
MAVRALVGPHPDPEVELVVGVGRPPRRQPLEEGEEVGQEQWLVLVDADPGRRVTGLHVHQPPLRNCVDDADRLRGVDVHPPDRHSHVDFPAAFVARLVPRPSLPHPDGAASLHVSPTGRDNASPSRWAARAAGA